MKKIDIILARYNEDISWILNHKHYFDNIFIFNKGQSIEFDDNFLIENIPNFGREAQTYFYFLTKYYDSIDENKIYIFSQAFPNNGIEEFMYKVKSLNEHTVYPFPLTNYCAGEKIFYEANKYHPAGLPIYNLLHHLFFTKKFVEKTDKHKTFYTGLWATQGKDLKFRTKKFYDYCLNFFGERKNPLEAYCFERMWHYIFSSQYLDWISHYEQIRKNYIAGSYRRMLIE